MVVLFIIITVAGFATALYFAFPDLRQSLSSNPVESPQPARPEKPQPQIRDTASDEAQINKLYRSYLDALENPDPESLRKFVQKKRLNELKEGGVDSLIYDQLTPDLSLTGIEIIQSFVEGDRGIVVTRAEKAEGVTDDKGNQLGAIGIAKLIYEEKGWKFFSQVWHINPTDDPVEPAMFWLKPSSTSSEAIRGLLSLGVEYGDPECLGAITRERVEVVKLCLQAGFSPNTPWSGEATAFDSAVAFMGRGNEENLEIVKAMIAAGANVNSTTGGGLTPLMNATVNCQQQFAEVLIKAGADVNKKNAIGMTALQFAENCPEIQRLLKQNGAQ